MKIKPADSRGKSDFGWLDSRHSFSFGNYHDPEWTSFGSLRVINDDRVDGGGGFPPHPHRDMEIVSIVLEGELGHKDSMGNGDVIRAGEVQYMSAGSGVVHSEMNPNDAQAVHFLQIWIEPDNKGYEPRYEKRKPEIAPGQWTAVLGESDQAISIRQDATLLWGKTNNDNSLSAEIPFGRKGWVQVMQGHGIANEEALREGDAVILEAGESIKLAGELDVLLFNLPA